MKWVPLSCNDDYLIAGGDSLNSAGYTSYVWCSGYTKLYGTTPRPSKICCVRGPLSQQRVKNHMNIQPPCGGDPLLLLSDFYNIEDAPIKPCIFTKKDVEHTMRLGKDKARYITPRNTLDTILTSIKNAPFVITDLYEGLVICDGLKVPTALIANDKVPFIVRDYLGNFSKRKSGFIEKIPATLDDFRNYRLRNAAKLKENLLTTIPSL
jgi:pyruvyltransferase